jgi:HNH endonuclease
MISVARLNEPSILTKKEALWTKKLLKQLPSTNTKYDDYGHKKIRAVLKEIFGEKCAYCEGKFTANSAPRVEHFRPKAKYPRLAYTWTNLLQVCERCNGHKLDYFPLGIEGPEINLDKFDLDDEAIYLAFRDQYDAVYHIDNTHKKDALLIDPCEDNPDSFFEFGEAKIGSKTFRGKLMCILCGLNRPELVEARRDIIDDIDHTIVMYNLSRAVPDSPEEKLNIAKLRKLSAKDAPFSACARAYIVKQGLRHLLI